MNLYTYCGNNPVNYVDPSGHKRIDTDYTYYTYEKVAFQKTSTITGYKTVTTEHLMTQVEFTNLNTMLYTMDGVFFNTDPDALLRGEHLFMDDPDNLMKKPGEAGITCNLEYVTKMDKELGSRTFWGFGEASVSFVSDATMVAGWFAKAAGAAGSAGVKVVSNVGTGASYVGYASSGIESLDKLSQGKINSTEALWNEAKGYFPIYGTYLGFKDAIKNINYKATFLR